MTTVDHSPRAAACTTAIVTTTAARTVISQPGWRRPASPADSQSTPIAASRHGAASHTVTRVNRTPRVAWWPSSWTSTASRSASLTCRARNRDSTPVVTATLCAPAAYAFGPGQRCTYRSTSPGSIRHRASAARHTGCTARA